MTTEGQDLLVVEMAVTADSRIVGLTVATSGLAERHGAAILGVDFAPRGPFLDTPAHIDAPLSDVDVLLVMTTASDAGTTSSAENLLLLDGARSPAPLEGAAGACHYGPVHRFGEPWRFADSHRRPDWRHHHVRDRLRAFRERGTGAIGAGYRACRGEHRYGPPHP
ncbi:MAG: hypothetical protein FJX31_07415 [Alphaproteobacteria bacterium]|nr:hypothetical protein [Alphaproteobacteria bacterium]